MREAQLYPKFLVSRFFLLLQESFRISLNYFEIWEKVWTD